MSRAVPATRVGGRLVAVGGLKLAVVDDGPAPTDLRDERQAVIRACNALGERLKAVLQTPPQEQSAKVALWRLGLEQAIGVIEGYRGEVRDLLV